MQSPAVVQGVPVNPPGLRADSTDYYSGTRSIYPLKTGTFAGVPVTFLLQGANGPCPLLAICNILLLRRQLTVSTGIKDIDFSTLIQYVADILLTKGSMGDEFHQSAVNDAMSILGKLNEGMDVNIRFTAVDAFDHSKETAVLDSLNIRLFHSWIISEDDITVYPYVSPLTYNDAVEKVVEYEETKSRAIETGNFEIVDREKFVEGETIAKWLESTSGQITSDGIIGVNSHMKEGDLAVFFRNNHFSVIFNKNDQLYALVTDLGYAKTSVMWESIDQLDGDTLYLDSNFLPVTGGTPAESDYEMALRLQYGNSNPAVHAGQAVVAGERSRADRTKAHPGCACSIM
jgi:hypothetical protein